MSIKYRETFEIIDEESAEYGDVKERGFTHNPDQPLETDFRDLVDMLGCTEPNCSDIDYATWFTVYGEMDYRNGEYENTSYHPVDDRDVRYFRKAWVVANGRTG